MADWIDDLKRVEEQHQKAKEEAVRLRLHQAQVIKGKLPTLWDSLGRQVQGDLESLRKAFPDNKQRHCTYEGRGNGFAIIGNAAHFPRHRVEVQFNTDAHVIEVNVWVNTTVFAQSAQERIYQIHIRVNDEDELVLTEGHNHYSVEDLSRRFCSDACGI